MHEWDRQDNWTRQADNNNQCSLQCVGRCLKLCYVGILWAYLCCVQCTLLCSAGQKLMPIVKDSTLISASRLLLHLLENPEIEALKPEAEDQRSKPWDSGSNQESWQPYQRQLLYSSCMSIKQMPSHGLHNILFVWVYIQQQLACIVQMSMVRTFMVVSQSTTMKLVMLSIAIHSSTLFSPLAASTLWWCLLCGAMGKFRSSFGL